MKSSWTMVNISTYILRLCKSALSSDSNNRCKEIEIAGHEVTQIRIKRTDL